MTAIQHLDWERTYEHFRWRLAVHKELRRLHDEGEIGAFAELALGISNENGNWSAAEHCLGPKILSENEDTHDRLYRLASAMLAAKTPREIPSIIYAGGLRYLKMGVGSELSCMLDPTRFWVTNTRSIWAHLVLKHGEKYQRADEELRLYRLNDPKSEMKWEAWVSLHREVGPSMVQLASRAQLHAFDDGLILVEDQRFLWADAVASTLYRVHHG